MCKMLFKPIDLNDSKEQPLTSSFQLASKVKAVGLLPFEQQVSGGEYLTLLHPPVLNDLHSDQPLETVLPRVSTEGCPLGFSINPRKRQRSSLLSGVKFIPSQDTTLYSFDSGTISSG